MKMRIRTLLCISAFSAASLLGLGVAAAQENGFYAKADAGGQLVQDIKLRDFFGLPLVPDSEVKLDPGVRLGLAGGYQFCPWFDLEAELGFYENRIDSVTAETRLHDSWYGNVPLLVNAKLQYPNRSPITPYIGAGAGFSETFLDIGRLSIMDAQGGVTSLHGSDSDAVFAWQAIAGLRYRLNDQMGISLEYRYFWADSPSWHADLGGSTPSDRFSFGPTRAHAISLAFDFHF
jgi:opacity protein-like surface antigen